MWFSREFWRGRGCSAVRDRSTVRDRSAATPRPDPGLEWRSLRDRRSATYDPGGICVLGRDQRERGALRTIPDILARTIPDIRARTASTLLVSLFLALLLSACNEPSEATTTASPKPPNILFAISDDQSWAHTSFAGAREISTPAFDRIATEGIYFENAYCASPSCAPSRAAILTGQEIWRLEEGGLLFGALPRKFPIFTDQLREAGYAIAHTAKGYDPANKTDPQYYSDPLGREYDTLRTPEIEGLLNVDYAGNFDQFLEQRDRDQPFFFWYGGKEPHREYREGSGVEAGKNLANIEVPPFLPDDSITRSDLADYYLEIEYFDEHLGRMITALERAGELENTIIVVTSDNGMPFPYAKTTLYEHGIHMPLAIRWGAGAKGGRRVEDFISFTDFAPTFLELAGHSPTPGTTGKSFAAQLSSDKSGFVDAERKQVVTAWERHTWCRPGGLTYPSRALRDGNLTYIVNYEPDRWPGGDPDYQSPHQGLFGDIDAGSLREWMIAHQDDPKVKPFFDLTFGKRRREELYDLSADPFQLNNLATDPDHQEDRARLEKALNAYLTETNDPRVAGHDPWVDMPYYFPGYDKRHLLGVGSRE